MLLQFLQCPVSRQVPGAVTSFPEPEPSQAEHNLLFLSSVPATAEAALPLPIPPPGHQPDHPCLGLSQDNPQGSSSHPDALQPDKINCKSPNELPRRFRCCPLQPLFFLGSGVVCVLSPLFFPNVGNSLGCRSQQGPAVSLLRVLCCSQQG